MDNESRRENRGPGIEKSPSPPKNTGGAAKLPPVGQPYWVRCEGYRTVAYFGEDGKWRSLHGDKELSGSVTIEGPA
jgi:hypothetical protein